jgi:hypothetical protein
MLTYLNSPQLKADFLGEIGKHEAADAFMKGSYGEGSGKNFRGCAIGCSLHSLNKINGKKQKTGDHARYEKELGLPTWLAYLEDNLFERLPLELAKTWPRRFAEAIPVGVVVDDLVLAKILRWVLADSEFGVRYATDDEDVRGYIDAVVAMFDAEIAGTCTADHREAAARAARAAWDAWAARAAWDTWDARAARAAWDARDARDAWDAATKSSRGKADAFSSALSEFVLALLRELPVSAEVTA